MNVFITCNVISQLYKPRKIVVEVVLMFVLSALFFVQSHFLFVAQQFIKSIQLFAENSFYFCSVDFYLRGSEYFLFGSLWLVERISSCLLSLIIFVPCLDLRSKSALSCDVLLYVFVALSFHSFSPMIIMIVWDDFKS